VAAQEQPQRSPALVNALEGVLFVESGGVPAGDARGHDAVSLV